MNSRLFFPLLLNLLWLVSPSQAWPARLSVVVDDRKPSHIKVIETLREKFGNQHVVQIHSISSVDLSNPIEKGLFFARVAAADLIIPIGDKPSQLIARELEDLPV